MAQERVERRLAAILAADMVGYSRLMEADEAGTIARQKAHRSELIDPEIAGHKGRIVKTMGDGVLVEFASVVDATECAVVIQRAMAEREADVAEERRIQYRIGINLGDIVIDGDDILGDGVNVAARLEGLAEPGGICIPRKVFHEVRNKLEVGYEFIGEQTVKNIETPIPVYRVLLKPEAAGQILGEGRPSRPRWQLGAVAAAVASVIAVAVTAVWWQPWVERVEPASVERMAYPLPDKPSIAVLPFDNLSGDPEQEYFSNGLTENIIATLSKNPNMFVIARNSTFTYKGKPVKVQQVAEELGVRYVLEGSVQRSGEQLRITAQLIDAVKGHHLWSERYDRKLADLFAVQDEITREVVTALQVKLTLGPRLVNKQTDNLKAYEHYLRGSEHMARGTKKDLKLARELFLKAIELDPKFSAARVGLGWTHHADARFGWSDDRPRSLKRAAELAEKALAMDDSEPDVHALMGSIHFLRREHDQAIAYAERAVQLSPNNDRFLAILALYLAYSERPAEAKGLIKKAMRLSPYYPAWYAGIFGLANRLTGHFEEAIAAYKVLLERKNYLLFANARLAVIHMEMGREKEAREFAAEVLRINPKFLVKNWPMRAPYKNPSDLERELDLLRKAGLPDNPPLKLPDKPSIAVLPFTNMSGDPEQEYFADGMTDDLITRISKLSGLVVISRTTAFTFKGKERKIEDIARELGVQYVLEGSVRRAGGAVRINAQLIDGRTGGHLWAEIFDRPYRDIFALQDEVQGKIVAALKVKLTDEEKREIARRPTDNLEAYENYLRAEQLRLTLNWAEYGEAFSLYGKALALDADFVAAHIGNARAAFRAWRLSWFVAIWPPKAKERMLSSLATVLKLDPDNAAALALQARVQLYLQNHDRALSLAQDAVRRHPQNPRVRAEMARVLLASERPDEAREALRRALSLAPKPTPELLLELGRYYLMLGEAERSVALLLRARKGGASGFATAFVLTAAYARLDDLDKAGAELKTARGYWFWMSVAMSRVSFAHYRNQQRVVDNLFNPWLKAGMPEWPYGFKGRAEDRLRNQDLKALYLGRPWVSTGTNPFGTPSVSLSDGSGEFRWVETDDHAKIKSPGTLTIESDMYCIRMDAMQMGRKSCSEVYRNPLGSADDNNEYLRVDIWGTHSFSIKPLEKE